MRERRHRGRARTERLQKPLRTRRRRARPPLVRRRPRSSPVQRYEVVTPALSAGPRHRDQRALQGPSGPQQVRGKGPHVHAAFTQGCAESVYQRRFGPDGRERADRSPRCMRTDDLLLLQLRGGASRAAGCDGGRRHLLVRGHRDPRSDTAATLGSILHAWGIKVSSAGTGTTQSKTPASVTKLLDTVDDDILAQGSARVAIVGRESPSHKLAERLVADMAGDSARESISEPGARATIRVTATAAYLSSGGAGLTKLLGLSPARRGLRALTRCRCRRGPPSTTIWSPRTRSRRCRRASLPAASTSVRAQTVYADGRLVRRLIWEVARSRSDRDADLSSGTDQLPVAETGPCPGPTGRRRCSRAGGSR